MTAGVYAITNIVTGARYIGSTADFEIRGRAHRSALRSGSVYANALLAAARREYGAAAFVVEMIEETEPDEATLEAAERRWLSHYAEIDRTLLYNSDLTGRRPRRTAALCRCLRCLKRRQHQRHEQPSGEDDE